tara:strand:+ start:33 stop:221 length:189 start_codon:yes stop_codon:yes gene_type:complete
MELETRDLLWLLFAVVIYGLFYLQNEITALKEEMEIKHDDISELQDKVGMFDRDINDEEWKV